MIAHHVSNPRLCGAESGIAFLAVPLCVVLLSSIEACKVETACITDPVGAGIVPVLLQCSIVREKSLTAITIRHRMVVVRGRERGDRREASLLNLYERVLSS
jgi:hypothetical protein